MTGLLSPVALFLPGTTHDYAIWQAGPSILSSQNVVGRRGRYFWRHRETRRSEPVDVGLIPARDPVGVKGRRGRRLTVAERRGDVGDRRSVSEQVRCEGVPQVIKSMARQPRGSDKTCPKPRKTSVAISLRRRPRAVRLGLNRSRRQGIAV